MVLHAFGYSLMLSHRYHIGESLLPSVRHFLRFVDAEEALAIGLVDRVVAPDAVYDEAVAWARALATGPAIALRAAKAAIDRGMDADLDTGLEIERVHFSALFGTEDQRVGMSTFVQKGPGQAEFTGS